MRLLFYLYFLICGSSQDDRFKIFPIEDLTDEGVASWNDIFSFCRNRGMTMATIVGQGFGFKKMKTFYITYFEKNQNCQSYFKVPYI